MAIKKSTQAKKTKKIPQLTKIKQTKTQDENYLAPIHAYIECIENDYRQLQNLFKIIPAKMEKSATVLKAKHKKSKEAVVKIGKHISELKKKQKKISTPKISQMLLEQEKKLAETKTITLALETELKQVTEQIQICKKMGKEYEFIEKSIQKIRKDSEKKSALKSKTPSKKKKQAVKPKKVTLSEDNALAHNEVLTEPAFSEE